MKQETRAPDDERVLCVHFGRSANCSSIGSVIDVLFVSGVAGTAILASLAVLLGGRDAEPNATSDHGDATRAPHEPPAKGAPHEPPAKSAPHERRE